MCSRRVCSLALVVSVTWAARAHGDVQLPFSPRLSATLSNGQQAIEAGVERTFGGLPDTTDVTQPGDGRATVTRGRLFASLSLPFSGGTVVRIDRNTTDWRVNLGGDLLSHCIDFGARCNVLRVIASIALAEFGEARLGADLVALE